MEPTVERRKHRRHPVICLGVYSSGPVQVREAIVLDLSMGGCRVARRIPYPPIERFNFNFGLVSPLHLCPQRDRALGKWLRIRCAVQELPERESEALTHLLGSLPPQGRTRHQILSERPHALPKAIERGRQSTE